MKLLTKKTVVAAVMAGLAVTSLAGCNRGGTAAPGPISVANPNAPPCFVSVSQYGGGT